MGGKSTKEVDLWHALEKTENKGRVRRTRPLFSGTFQPLGGNQQTQFNGLLDGLAATVYIQLLVDLNGMSLDRPW